MNGVKSMKPRELVGAPDAPKGACPVWGALDGNLLPKCSKALSFDSGCLSGAGRAWGKPHSASCVWRPHSTPLQATANSLRSCVAPAISGA